MCGKFAAEARLHHRMQRKQIPRPVENTSCGLMTRDDERHDLIIQLPVTHCCAGVLVASLHQHREVIEVLDIMLAALLDQLRNKLPERAEPIHKIKITGGLSHYDRK